MVSPFHSSLNLFIVGGLKEHSGRNASKLKAPFLLSVKVYRHVECGTGRDQVAGTINREFWSTHHNHGESKLRLRFQSKPISRHRLENIWLWILCVRMWGPNFTWSSCPGSWAGKGGRAGAGGAVWVYTWQEPVLWANLFDRPVQWWLYNAETLSPVARCTVCDGLQQTPPQRAAESSVRGRCARISAFPLQGGGAELLLPLDLPRECDLR